jgi:transposase
VDQAARKAHSGTDEHGELLAAEQFSHDEAGIGALITLLLGHSVECCAIERPDGLLVGRLLAAGVVVLAIHPNQVKAARDRYRAAAGKNDRFDAFVLCELARTDRHRFPVLAPSRDETLALKTLVRSREDLVDARVALANQLRAQLQAFWPGAQQIFWGSRQRNRARVPLAARDRSSSARCPGVLEGRSRSEPAAHCETTRYLSPVPRTGGVMRSRRACRAGKGCGPTEVVPQPVGQLRCCPPLGARRRRSSACSAGLTARSPSHPGAPVASRRPGD